MAGTWRGFTEEELGSFGNNKEGKNKKTAQNKKTANLVTGESKPSGKERKSVKYSKENSEIDHDIPEGARLCKPQEESVPLIGNSPQKKESQETESASPTVMGSNSVCLKVIEGKAYELVDRNCTDVSKATLEIFETRQKMLEEQNKRRKEMLAKVIFARKKQTTEEAKRLQHIQEELQKLDMLLSNDVGILRNKIEEASLEFAEAQKRYAKAEKEFLDAKQNLFGKLEKKELLTKLLCTIIEQNELRKAQKLSELMEKLEINEAGMEGNPALSSIIVTSGCQSALKEKEANNEKVDVNRVKQPS